MLAPISWLKDYVDIDVKPEILAKKLVSIGFEVEDIIYQEKQVSNVVVAKILSFEKHPNADKLKVCKIDIGSEILQVITNVSNISNNDVIALALDGAKLAGGLNIVKGQIRGVESDGMLCGLEELGLTEDDVVNQKMGDIIRFDSNTTLGQNALVALGFNDVILDVAVTANRPDCNSIYKLAKEVAVALNVNCKNPEIHFETKGDDVNNYVSVDVKNNQLCPRYMAAAVKNIKIFPSSQLIKSRLRAVGIRPINNIVDITNYVLTEIGQPMHSFDKRELDGDKIVVRNAIEGEKIISLDGKENVLTKDMLVICDAYKPVAVAGIMGGLNSGIKDDTNQVVFESAKFARDNVRHTSKALNLRSDSSARFEKGIDFASQEYGLKRALTLVYESNSGDIVDGLIDVKVPYEKVREITFTTKKMQEILGCKVPKAKMISIFERLGIEVKDNGKTLIAVVKEDRDDIVGVNDLTEEFIRVYGYKHINPTLFEFAQLTKGSIPDKMKFVSRVKNILSSVGLSEAVSYSFTSPKFVEQLLLDEKDVRRNYIKIINPLGEALSAMRTTLTHNMIEALSYNITHFNKSASLFEIAKVYLPKELPLKELPYEEEKLSIGMYGDDVDFYSIKSPIEALFKALHIEAKYIRSNEKFLHPGRSASIIVNGVEVGFVGEIHPDVLNNYETNNYRVYVAEISIDKIFTDNCLEKKKFKVFSKFPSIERDFALVVKEDLMVGDMVDAIKSANIKFLTDVKIFDIFKSEHIGVGKKSVAMNFSFANVEKTLTDDEINLEMDKILSILKKKFGAKLR